MKLFIFSALAVLTLTVFTPRAQALFGHVTAEKNRREQAEQHLNSTRLWLPPSPTSSERPLAAEGGTMQRQENKWRANIPGFVH